MTRKSIIFIILLLSILMTLFVPTAAAQDSACGDLLLLHMHGGQIKTMTLKFEGGKLYQLVKLEAGGVYEFMASDLPPFPPVTIVFWVPEEVDLVQMWNLSEEGCPPSDGRLNNSVFGVVYTSEENGITVYDANGVLLLQVSMDEVANVPAEVNSAFLVKQAGIVAVYKLPGGEFQVNVTTPEGKIEGTILDTVPATVSHPAP